jgi:hypothetical protein
VLLVYSACGCYDRCAADLHVMSFPLCCYCACNTCCALLQFIHGPGVAGELNSQDLDTALSNGPQVKPISARAPPSLSHDG